MHPLAGCSAARITASQWQTHRSGVAACAGSAAAPQKLCTPSPSLSRRMWQGGLRGSAPSFRAGPPPLQGRPAVWACCQLASPPTAQPRQPARNPTDKLAAWTVGPCASAVSYRLTMMML